MNIAILVVCLVNTLLIMRLMKVLIRMNEAYEEMGEDVINSRRLVLMNNEDIALLSEQINELNITQDNDEEREHEAGPALADDQPSLFGSWESEAEAGNPEGGTESAGDDGSSGDEEPVRIREIPLGPVITEEDFRHSQIEIRRLKAVAGNLSRLSDQQRDELLNNLQIHENVVEEYRLQSEV